jgi:hypothetical protein
MLHAEMVASGELVEGEEECVEESIEHEDLQTKTFEVKCNDLTVCIKMTCLVDSFLLVMCSDDRMDHMVTAIKTPYEDMPTSSGACLGSTYICVSLSFIYYLFLEPVILGTSENDFGERFAKLLSKRTGKVI